MKPGGRVLRETRPRRRRRLLYTTDRGGRASPPPPWARGPVGPLVLRVSASPPPRLSVLDATGWPRPPIQPRRRRRRRQRQQVSSENKAPARPTWSSAREHYRAPEGTSWKSGPRMRAAGSLPEVRDSALPTFIARRHALGAQEWGGLSPTLTHTRAAVLRSQVGRVLLLSRTAKLTVPPQKNLLCGCEKRGSGGPAGDCD